MKKHFKLSVFGPSGNWFPRPLIVLFVTLLFSCRETVDDLTLPNTKPTPDNCRFQDIGNLCELSFDTLGAERSLWRVSGQPCSYFDLNAEHLEILRMEKADWIILKNVPFWMVANWELRVKQQVESVCQDINTGSFVTCYPNEFPEFPDKKGCQTVCPDNPVIIIPTMGLESNLGKIQYEVTVEGFCGRILLYGFNIDQ